jgi:DNA-binding transcriptional regulator YdaS (Cro superfamily)
MARPGRRRRTQISTGDLAGYGSVSNETVDVDRAARGLSASKTAVRQAIRQAKTALSNTFFRRMSGRREADVAEGASPRGMLQAAYGRGPRGGAVNAKAAAQDLGVSPRTVRRWAAGTQQPSPDHLKALQTSARGATRTKSGRRAATADFRTSPQGSQALRTGSKLWISGEQGVGGYDQGYARDRRVATDINPEELEAMLHAYEESGDRGLREWMTGIFDDKYVAGWDFVTIDDFGIGTPE